MSTPAIRILVADDEQAILQDYKSIFGESAAPANDSLDALSATLFGDDAMVEPDTSFEVMYCQQGMDAVYAVANAKEEGAPFSVAFLDVRMPPGINGIDAARRIRALDPNVNIVIVTGFSDIHPREIAEKVPTLDKLFYVNKPFQPSEIEQYSRALARKWLVEKDMLDLNEELSLRCRDLEAANRAVRQAQTEAEEADRAKSDFLTIMSHEFRTPLNTIVGFSDALMAGIKGDLDAGLLDNVNEINKVGKSLLGMVEDIIDAIQLQLNEARLIISRTHIDQQIIKVTESLCEDAAHCKIDLQVDLGTPDKSAMLDQVRFCKALTHLVRNAISFSPPGNNIQVTTSTQGVIATIKVVDHGAGMTGQQLRQALQPLTDPDASRGRSKNSMDLGLSLGLGLGLPVAKQMLERMGVHVDITTAPGKGTTVELTVPTVE